MHDHDLDLIASLADGSLDDQADARALVETCQQCRQEYDSQLSIIGSLSGVAPARLTDLEKAALHRDLWTELRGDAAKSAPSSPWWYRWSYAAAGLFVVVGLVAVLNQGLFGAFAGESGATFSEVSSGLDGGASAESVNPMSQYDAGESSSPTTTAAAGDSNVSTTTAAAESAPDYETLAAETRLQQLPAANRTNAVSEEDADCVSAAGLENQEVVGTVESDRIYLIAVPDDVELNAETPVNFVDTTTCTVAHVEE